MTIFDTNNETELFKSLNKTLMKHHGDSLLFFNEYEDENEAELIWSMLNE